MSEITLFSPPCGLYWENFVYLHFAKYKIEMISYQSGNVDMPSLDFAKVSRWLTGIASGYGRRIGDLAYKFVDDEEILDVNRQFLDHDYYTDIITFDYSIGKRVGADIYISLDTVASNSAESGLDYNEELLRVIVHGLLHLCGLKDKTAEERAAMESAENAALRLFPAA